MCATRCRALNTSNARPGAAIAYMFGEMANCCVYWW